MWKDVCSCNKNSTKHIDDIELEKWKLKDENAHVLLKYSIINEMFVHIENETDACNAWKTFNKMYDTQLESKLVIARLLKQRLDEGGCFGDFVALVRKNIGSN